MTKPKAKLNNRHRAFTFVEIVAAVALLAIILSSVLVLMDRFVGSVIDMRLRGEAFELARSNMETLLSEGQLPDVYEYGDSETNPDIQWETIVEPFTETYKDRMWIRAVCNASFINSHDEEETVELEHWITNLTAAQVRQILAQQEVEEAYMDLLEAGQYTEQQQATIAYLEQEGLDVEQYKELLEQQRRKKLEFLDSKGMDGYEAYVETLIEEENDFLERLGMDFDAYNNFAKDYIPPASDADSGTEPGSDSDAEPETDPETQPEPDGGPDTKPPEPKRKPEPEPKPNQGPQIDWDKIPPELREMIRQLLNQ